MLVLFSGATRSATRSHEHVMNLFAAAVLRAHCPHDLRLVLDLGGDARNGHELNYRSLASTFYLSEKQAALSWYSPVTSSAAPSARTDIISHADPS